MELSIIQSPYDAHSNTLFTTIKKFLVDRNIYDRSSESYPYTSVKNSYKLRLTDCTEVVTVKVNDITWIVYDGTSGSSTFDFYIIPKLFTNTITVEDVSGNVLTFLKINCYKLNLFLAFTAYKFKQIWNTLYQTLADTYIDTGLVTDLDGTSLSPTNKALSEFGILLGIDRYSQFTQSQYITFLHNVYLGNLHAGTNRSIYQIQEALSYWINRIDVIPLEDYRRTEDISIGKIYQDGTDYTKITIYPNYDFSKSESEWNILPYYNDAPDSSTISIFSVYTDSTKDDVTSESKIKFSNDFEFYKTEYLITDTISSDFIYNDTTGGITGFVNSKYVILSKPSVDGTIYSVSCVGEVDVSESVVREFENNIVDLGTTYLTDATTGEQYLTSVSLTYKTFDIPKVYAKLVKDTTTGDITNVLQNALIKDYNTKTTKGDAVYGGYMDRNYGSVVIIIRASRKIDNELKNIINQLIRNYLPIHIKYYIVWSTIGIWDYWGQTDITFGDFGTGGAYYDITFGDLK